MPSVFTFWHLPEEDQALLDLVGGTGELYAYPSGWFEMPSALEAKPVQSMSDCSILLLTHRDLLGLVSPETQEISGRSRYGLTAMRSCVVAFDRGCLNGRRLGLSNLAAYWDGLNSDCSELVTKPAEFVAWGKWVFSRFRKFAPVKVGSYRATKAVATAAAEDVVELVEY